MIPALVLAVLAVALGGLAWAGQRRFVFFPSQVVPDQLPDDVAPVTLVTDDGLELAAWEVAAVPEGTPGSRPAGSGRGRVPPGTSIVLFHGNGGNRVGRLRLGRRLAATGATVLLVDYRGYGGNPGRPTADGLARDARAAVAWVDAHDGLHPDRVVLLGESLGAAVAIEVATRHPPAALVLRSPFTSLADVARHHYPLVPAWFLRDRWPNTSRLGGLAVPTLVVAGGTDRVVPVEQSERVHAAAPGPAELVVVEGADHDDPALVHGNRLVTAITDFLAAHLPTDPPSS